MPDTLKSLMSVLSGNQLIRQRYKLYSGQHLPDPDPDIRYNPILERSAFCMSCPVCILAQRYLPNEESQRISRYFCLLFQNTLFTFLDRK